MGHLVAADWLMHGIMYDSPVSGYTLEKPFSQVAGELGGVPVADHISRDFSLPHVVTYACTTTTTYARARDCKRIAESGCTRHVCHTRNRLL